MQSRVVRVDSKGWNVRLVEETPVAFVLGEGRMTRLPGDATEPGQIHNNLMNSSGSQQATHDQRPQNVDLMFDDV